MEAGIYQVKGKERYLLGLNQQYNLLASSHLSEGLQGGKKCPELCMNGWHQSYNNHQGETSVTRLDHPYSMTPLRDQKKHSKAPTVKI